MRTSFTVLGLVALSFTLSAAPFAQPQKEVVVPVHQEPRHHLVFDSPSTRVLDVQIPPGDTTLFHTHSDPILYVTISTSRTRSQNLGAAWSGPPGASASARAEAAGRESVLSEPSTPRGRMMSTTSYGEKPQTHRVNNFGTTLFRLIGITNPSTGDASETPSDGFSGSPEIANRWFRGYRHALSGELSGNHRHANPVVIVNVEGQAAVLTDTTWRELAAPGALAFVEAGTVHALRGKTDGAQVVEVEIRRTSVK